MQASKEVWGKIFGTIATREKFAAMRRSWPSTNGTRLKANDSWNAATATARSRWTSPARAPRGPGARRFLFSGERTCIDCHKGIAHRLPDMAGVPGWQ